jgi:hypothetical protein
MINRGNLIEESLEKGRLRVLAYDSSRLMFVSGNGDLIRTALAAGASTAEEMSKHKLGAFATAVDVPFGSVKKFRINESSGASYVQYTTPAGKTNSFEIRIADASARGRFLDEFEQAASVHNLTKQTQNASLISVTWFPIAVMLGAFLVGGAMTVLQASRGEIDTSEISSAGGRSARKANGLVLLLTSASNALGFWGTMLVTAAVMFCCGAYAFLKSKSPPKIRTYTP